MIQMHKSNLIMHIVNVLEHKKARAVLEHLKQITLDQPCWVPGADTSFGYAREGQNSIVREIQQRIRRANEPIE